MSIAPVKSRSASGFTLLEITFAVVILAMMSVAIYRFVQTNMAAVRISSEQTAIDSQYEGLHELLTTEWQSLPAGDGRLTGEPFKTDGVSRDRITWLCDAGPGLLTRYATDNYHVTLQLKRAPDKKKGTVLGLSRTPEATDAGDETWVPLIDNVRSLEIRYYDPRLNSWVERWTDTVTLPRLVRLVIGRPDSRVPWDTIIALGRTPL